jgi:hypothetical protein
MHDWWIALCAAAVGVVHYLPDTLVDYRQHGGQRIGARGFAGLARRPGDWLRKMARIYATAFAQAAALRARLDERLPTAATEARQAAATRTLERFLALADRPGPARSLGLLRMGIRCRHPALTGLLYGQALLLRPPSAGDARGAQ